jgi:hypothetical protein
VGAPPPLGELVADDRVKQVFTDLHTKHGGLEVNRPDGFTVGVIYI